MSSVNKISTVNKMSAKAIEECTVCCEPYNKSTRAPVDCERAGCNYKACTECVRAYLLTSVNEPHCMECKAKMVREIYAQFAEGVACGGLSPPP